MVALVKEKYDLLPWHVKLRLERYGNKPHLRQTSSGQWYVTNSPDFMTYGLYPSFRAGYSANPDILFEFEIAEDWVQRQNEQFPLTPRHIN